MGARYQPYPEYKPSGLNFYEEIPKDWKIKRIEHYVEFITGFAFKSESFLYEDGVRLVRGDNVTEGQLRWGDKTRFWSMIARDIEPYLLRDRDILIGMDGSKVGKNYAVVDKADLPLLLVQRVARLRSKTGLDYRFIAYIIGSELFQNWVSIVKTDPAIPHISPADIKKFSFPFPSLVEQKKISDFLKDELSKIDTLIDKQQQLIKLLKEKRQAVISHAVTKGLNPDVSMKDSGVEWLGEVPEHWVVTRAKFLFDLITSGSRGWAEFYADEGALFFRIANLTRDTIEPKLESIQYVNPPTGAEGGRAEIRNDDLLISITADLGSVCVANNEIEGGFVSQHVSLCRPNNKVAASRWLGYFVLSDCAKEQLLGSGYGGTKIQLSLEDIRELCIALPSGDEQAQIANFIDVELSKFTKIMEKANAQIGLLQERRVALISAAVTGKIDVRGWHR